MEGSACTNCGNYLEIYVRLPVVFRFSSILWGVLLSILFMYRRKWFNRGWSWFLGGSGLGVGRVPSDRSGLQDYLEV